MKNEWLLQRNFLNKYSANHVRSYTHVLHILTVATEETQGLQNLRFSAHLAGVPINVIGLGNKYVDFYDKLRWYHEFLLTSHPSTTCSSTNNENCYEIDDNDIVLIIDAYDVLIFPSIREIGKKLSKSPFPIVSCVEHHLHPEETVGSLYYWGGSPSFFFPHDDDSRARYLNSGCVVGRAGQIRRLFQFAATYGYTRRDDQQVFTHFYFASPHSIGLDVSNTFFLTGYGFAKVFPEKEIVITEAFDLNYKWILSDNNNDAGGTQRNRSPDASLRIDSLFISLLHCNNKNQNNLYDAAHTKIWEIYNRYYSGR